MRQPRRTRLFHLDRFGERLEGSVNEEFRFHLETRIEQLIKEGHSAEAARAEALKQFGDPESWAEQCRRIDRGGSRRRVLSDLLFDLLGDVRLALRSLGKARGYAAVTVVSLAVGIGVNSALFQAMHAVWVAPVPAVSEPGRVVDPVIVQEGSDWWGWTYPDFHAVLDADTPFESLTAWSRKARPSGPRLEEKGYTLPTHQPAISTCWEPTQFGGGVSCLPKGEDRVGTPSLSSVMICGRAGSADVPTFWVKRSP